MRAVLVSVARLAANVAFSKYFVRDRLAHSFIKSEVLAAKQGLFLHVLLSNPSSVRRNAALNQMNRFKS